MIDFAVRYDMILFGIVENASRAKDEKGRELVYRLDAKRLPGIGKKK